MMIKRCLMLLTLMACCAALSFAQTDGGIGGHAPAKSQGVTSNNFTLTGYECTPSQTSPDCSLFSGGVQEIFSFYNQSGTPFNSISVNLQFDPSNAGQYVGCTLANIEPTWTMSNCLGTGVLIPSSGDVTLTFQQGLGGEGVGCYDANPIGGPDAPIGNANQACLDNSVNAINTDLASGGTAKDPYVYYYPPAGSGFNAVPPPVQTSGACTVPPNSGFPINTILPWLVCGQDSWVLGIGLLGQPTGTPGYGPFTCSQNDLTCQNSIPVATAEVFANPEPPTLLLVGAAMIAMSLALMKKKAHA